MGDGVVDCGSARISERNVMAADLIFSDLLSHSLIIAVASSLVSVGGNTKFPDLLACLLMMSSSNRSVTFNLVT